MVAEKVRAASDPQPPIVPEEILYPRINRSSTEEVMDTRFAMYSECRDHSLAPMEIIDAVETGVPEQPLFWVLSSGGLNESDNVTVIPTLASTRYGTEAPEELTKELPETTDELIAYLLSDQLDLSKTLKHAPARNGKCLPRATVAYIAYDLLVSSSRPGPFLMELLKKLLDVDRSKIGQSKQYSARLAAVWIIAQAPQVDSQTVARELGVNRSSVSRWRSDPSFQKEVRNMEDYVAGLKARGKWLAFEQQACEGKHWRRFPSK